MAYEMIYVGAVLLAAGIILGHFFPNRYWIALIIVGIILLAVGIILLLLPSMPNFILPYAMTLPSIVS